MQVLACNMTGLLLRQQAAKQYLCTYHHTYISVGPALPCLLSQLGVSTSLHVAPVCVCLLHRLLADVLNCLPHRFSTHTPRSSPHPRPAVMPRGHRRGLQLASMTATTSTPPPSASWVRHPQRLKSRHTASEAGKAQARRAAHSPSTVPDGTEF